MKTTEESIAQANEIIDKLEPQVLEGSQRQYMVNMLVAMYGWGARDGLVRGAPVSTKDALDALRDLQDKNNNPAIPAAISEIERLWSENVTMRGTLDTIRLAVNAARGDA